MGLPIHEQIREAIKRSTNVLITTGENPATDAIASALALSSSLQRLKKNVKVVCHNFTLPANHTFLPKSKEISRELTALRKFIITVDTSRTKVEELSYDIADDKLHVYITPKDGFFEDADVTTAAGAFAYDLIIVVDTPDLPSLGPLYENNAEFFYHTPIVVIDHNPANERFGQINHVEVNATSTSEVVFELLQQLEGKLINEYVATQLLAGIISKTKSFQSQKVTPRTLSIASHLIASGARRDEIVQHLFRTKSVATLKSWGDILSRLQTDKDHKIVWATIRAADVPQRALSSEDLREVIDQLIVNAPEADSIVLLYESARQDVRGVMSTPRAFDAKKHFKDFSPSGSGDFTEIRSQGRGVEDVERTILDTLRQHAKA